MNYYYPDSSNISGQKEFLDFYSNCYYLQTKKEVEEVIPKLRGKEKYSPKDLFRILAWKAGKIDFFKSNKDKLIFCKGWEENNLVIDLYGKSLNVELLTRRVNETPSDIESYIDNIASIELQSRDRSKNIKLGCVYTATILYFKSEKESCIYDRFARKAVYAVSNNVVPYTHIPDETYNEKNFAAIYQKFQNSVKDIFGGNIDRKVDQALWQYGHLFK